MPPILNAQGISKAFGAKPLFQDVSFTVSEGDRIGLIGPNGSGKSTLLRILAGTEVPDSGDLAIRKRLRLSYVAQDSKFAPGESVRAVVERALRDSSAPESEHGAHFAETLGRAGFEDLDAEASALSGGWQKRLAIVEALVQAPDVLLGMSRPIIWTWPGSNGSKICLRDRSSLASWSAMTATFWRM